VLNIGDVVDGKYKILNQIGQGGMSVVWLAMNERANKQWAIKEVRKDGVDNYEVVKQSLIAEVEHLKRLHHANLPSIIDVIDTADTLLVVMDYIEGNSLAQALRDYGGALPQEQVVSWAKQLCAVLGYLHTRNPPIIYRDLKPANVMLQPDGTVKIIDFGTAREFKEGRADDTISLGTQGYAAPEQYGNHQTDPRTDIYNLGATIYHLVAGHNPSEPPYVMNPIRQWNPQLSSGLESIIIKCTQRNPDERYQNCAELLYDLDRYRELDYEYIRSQRKKWRGFLASAILTMVFVLGAVGLGVARSYQLSISYQALIEKAQEEYGNGPLDTVAGYYSQAASLDPGNAQAYTDFLVLIKRDQVFDEAENNLIRRMLNENNGSVTTNADRFKAQDPSTYDEFAYDLGIVYYFAYDGKGDKGRAESWLNIAAESATLDAQKKELARRLAFIASNYSLFLSSTASIGGHEELLNDEAFSPRDFWNQLTELSDGDLVATAGSTFIAIGVYRELVYQIMEHTILFQRGGITEIELDEQLNKATNGLGSIVAQGESEAISIRTTLSQIEIARERVATTYENSSFSEDTTAMAATGNQIAADSRRP
jgi:serine/threonine-protein kinase